MTIDDGLLDTPFDMKTYGRVDICDVTQTLFNSLSGVELTEIRTLKAESRVVGVTLSITGSGPFHFWVDGDELYWGDQEALICHDWHNQPVLSASERITF